MSDTSRKDALIEQRKKLDTVVQNFEDSSFINPDRAAIIALTDAVNLLLEEAAERA